MQHKEARHRFARLVDHPVANLFVRRLRRFAWSLALVVVSSFALVRLVPGDPVRTSLGITATTAAIDARRQELGLNGSLLGQLVDYLSRLLHGDWGHSFITQLPVIELVTQRLPKTAQLALLAFAVAIFIGIPLGTIFGVLTANGGHRRLDVAFSSGVGVLALIPEFVFAALLVLLFAVLLKWFPVAGQSGAASYVLPTIALSTPLTAGLARLVRLETQRVLGMEYMRMAKAKRLPWHRVYLRHLLPNLMNATATVAGLVLGGLLAGTVLIETVFAWPGLGNAFVVAIQQRDYPVIQGLTLVFGALVLLINFSVDVIITLVDPQSRVGTS